MKILIKVDGGLVTQVICSDDGEGKHLDIVDTDLPETGQGGLFVDGVDIEEVSPARYKKLIKDYEKLDEINKFL